MPRLPGRRRTAGRVTERVAVRAPQLHLALRSFCLGAFVHLGRCLEEGDELRFSFAEHAQRAGPAFYEYRPLVRSFIEVHATALASRDDARLALGELLREPAAAIYARSDAVPSAEQALFRTVLSSLLISTAEACGGFDWDDIAFDRAYAELEASLFGEARVYAAAAPLVGLSVVTQIELGGSLRIRAADTAKDEPAFSWPEAQGLLPPEWGRAADRYCVVELERGLKTGEAPPDAPSELADAVTAMRLATAAPVATGPAIFERLDSRPFGIRTSLPIAAAQPSGEPDRLDSFRAALARELLSGLVLTEVDGQLAEALDRWELSLFQDEPSRSEQLRGSLAALLGEAWVLRAAVLLEPNSNERRLLHASLRTLASGGESSPTVADSTRRALVEVLRYGDRPALLDSLDEVLLSLRQAHGRRAACEQRAAAV